MMTSAAPTIAERLLARLLDHNPYRDAILGDLHEGAHEEAHESKIEATRWYRREVLRSLVALLPSAAVRERHALAGAGLGALLYTLSVKASSVLAVLITDWMPASHVALRWAAYLIVILAAGLLAGVALGRIHKLPISCSLIFIAMAIGAGFHHVYISRSSEIAFRLTKVLVFIIASLAGMTWGISGELSVGDRRGRTFARRN
jgi:hypothetical protein